MSTLYFILSNRLEYRKSGFTTYRFFLHIQVYKKFEIRSLYLFIGFNARLYAQSLIKDAVLHLIDAHF